LLSLIGACQIPVHVRKFAVPPPQIPCSRNDELIAKGQQNAAYRFQTAINSAYESAKFAVNSLLAGNFDPETGSRQTASTASHTHFPLGAVGRKFARHFRQLSRG
jgi:hypothetical protein